MAKRSGNRSSRSERKAGRDRAWRARQHGLPERVEPLRVRAATPEPLSAEGDDRSSDAPAPRATKASGVPTVVKVVGGALAVLAGVYVLTHFRDDAVSEATPEPATSSAPAAASVATPEPEALPSTEPAPEPPPAAPAASAVEPVAPVVAAPVVSAPEKPKALRPVGAPKPVVAAPVAPAPVAPAPVAAPKPVVPAPAPPKPPAPAAPPADNPY